jgi:DNA polymerase-3 subunit delta'
MALKDFPEHQYGIQLLQRSLARKRLAHAYLFTGHQLDEVEAIARALAKTLNCLRPVKAGAVAIDSCEACLSCRKIERDNHADVRWVRPESKSRVITIAQMRELMREINLKPTEAEYKVAIIVAADRLNVQAANAFLKTLEEPPAKSVLILLSSEPQRILETIVSRCLRLNFAGEGPRPLTPAEQAWLAGFSETAASEQTNLLGRYRLMDVLLQKLNEMKGGIEERLTARSPLQHYDEVEKELRERWEEELAAAIEAEYRRQRTDLVAMLQRWLRDVWLQTVAAGQGLLSFPELASTSRMARRVTPAEALENLQIIEGAQRLLHTNVQEALALEVGLLKLHL